MLSKEILSESTVSLSDLFTNYSQQFLKPFEKVVNPDLKKGMHLDFELSDRKHNHKISPILRLARVEDAEEITKIYTELYEGTYPYKEMEEIESVREMILDPNIQWIIYQDPSYNIAGCITFVLDFQQKRGYIRGFMLKKKYQGHIDITKAMIGSMITMLYKFKDKIYTWYVENRTAHAKSQYAMWVCGIAPIGFYPNKDKFLGKVESDLMQICYDERALRKFRINIAPKIIPQAHGCYQYANGRYDLGECQIENPDIDLDFHLINQVKKNFNKRVEKDKFGYETIIFSLKNSDSFFEFLYTPQVKNLEKTKYQVDSLEELYFFIQEFIKCGKELGVRYSEVFVSAYEPAHQKLFENAGLSPRGYIPSWKYDKSEGVFRDNILFNSFTGDVSDKTCLIDEAQELLQVLEIEFVAADNNLGEARSIQKFPAYYTLKSKVQKIWDFPKVVKSVLLGGLILYLSFLIGSVFAADYLGPAGYSIIKHTISKLGSYGTTPVPYLFDFACYIGGMSTILFNCYLSKRIEPSQESDSKGFQLFHKLRLCGAKMGVVGGIGIMLVGIFSLERSFGIAHGISSLVAFGGYILSIFAFSISIIKYNTTIPKSLAFFGFLPLILFITYLIVLSPFLEWLLFISILTSLAPLVLWLSFR